MACRCAPALDQLRKELNARYPNRDKASDGCCGDAAHAARKSDHNPDASGYAHARDFDENIHPHSTDPAPLKFLVPILLDDPRTKYVIYETRIHRPGQPSRHYDGSNPHDHHLHLSILPGATHDTRPWFDGPIPTEDDFMAALTDKQQIELYAWVRDLHAALAEHVRPTHEAVAANGPLDKQIKEIRRNTRP